MRGSGNIKSPSPEEIQKVVDQIKKTEFWLCSQFADVLLRFIEITSIKDKVSSRQLQGTAMYFLVLEGGRTTPTQLARMMLRSKDGMTKVIDSLEKEGLVVRDYTDKDRRLTYVKLTMAGLEWAMQRFSKGNIRAQQVMSCLDVAEWKTLVNLTEKVRKRLISVLEDI